LIGVVISRPGILLLAQRADVHPAAGAQIAQRTLRNASR
jgi:hypothetical protein